MAMTMAAHGHGLAGSGEARPRRVRLSSGELPEFTTKLTKHRGEDGKAAMVVGHVERQLRRGPVMAAVEETANTPLPSPNRHG